MDDVYPIAIDEACGLASGVDKAIWDRVVRSADVDGHARAQPKWDLHYDQLSCGAFEGFVHHAQLPGLRVIHEVSSQAVHQQGTLCEDVYSFGMAIHQEGPAFFKGQALNPGELMLGRGDELDLCSPVNFALIAVVVDASIVDAIVPEIYGRPSAPCWSRSLVADAQPARAGVVQDFHLAVLSQIRAHPQLLADPVTALQLRDRLLFDWLSVLPAETDASSAAVVEARRRLVRRACAFMLATPDTPPSIEEACARLGASRRKLEECFKETLGMAPARYLRAVRLNGVRRELRRAVHGTSTVADAAARWGFWHQGEFSNLYKHQFGELPSTTLRLGR